MNEIKHIFTTCLFKIFEICIIFILHPAYIYSLFFYVIDPIDCSGIPCHLAWIFNENLIGQVSNAQCANGTFIKELDPNVFIECKVMNILNYDHFLNVNCKWSFEFKLIFGF